MSILQSFIFYFVLAAALVVQSGAAQANEKGSRAVFIPMVFGTDIGRMLTASCLSAIEQTYEVDWTRFSKDAIDDHEVALIRVVSALKAKDSSRLLQLSDPKLGRDPQLFNEQASHYFRQFQNTVLLKVKAYYEIDRIGIFFVEVNIGGDVGQAPFAFAIDDAGKMGFLPYLTQSVPLQLLLEWYSSELEGGRSKAKSYCSKELLDSMTHAMNFRSTPERSGGFTRVLLRGSAIDPGRPNPTHVRLLAWISRSKDVLRSGEFAEFLENFETKSKDRFADWYSSTKDDDKKRFRSEYLAQTPYYAFNLDSLLVVYLREESSGVTIRFAHQKADGSLKWINVGYVTLLDNVFSNRAMTDSAVGNPPFDQLRIRSSHSREILRNSK